MQWLAGTATRVKTNIPGAGAAAAQGWGGGAEFRSITFYEVLTERQNQRNFLGLRCHASQCVCSVSLLEQFSPSAKAHGDMFS